MKSRNYSAGGIITVGAISLSAISMERSTVSTIAVGPSPAGLAVTPDGSAIYVTNATGPISSANGGIGNTASANVTVSSMVTLSTLFFERDWPLRYQYVNGKL